MPEETAEPRTPAEHGRDPTTLRQVRADLIKEAVKRDQRVAAALSLKLDTYHAQVMAAITTLTEGQATHAKWMQARDTDQAEIDRAKAEQQQKEVWTAEQHNAQRAARAAQRARLAPFLPIFLGSLVGLAASCMVFILENLQTLHWSRETQIILVVVALAVVGATAIVKYAA